MSELGELTATAGKTEFSHIPDWYEWERENVIKEVKAGTYSSTSNVRIESLPNERFYVFKEPGVLTHNMSGFNLKGSYKGEGFDIDWPAPTMYSCHIEYDFRGRGDCVDLNTSDDTLYLFPSAKDFAITKVALATEELYNAIQERVST
ncbi:MAG: hypothetical protein LBC73_05525, partial [Oscillospiraceae bacterium]|jgi:hypothetical protein|nr:hypothetical protein [Oscillospiraceae bacterium]